MLHQLASRLLQQALKLKQTGRSLRPHLRQWVQTAPPLLRCHRYGNLQPVLPCEGQ